MNLYDLLTDLFDNGDISDVAPDYAEPGYAKDGDKDIVFANWNPEHMARLAGILERRGYTIEWSDEWTVCSHCYKAFRTQPDSYSWKMHGVFLEDDCEMVCGDCIVDNPHWLTDDIMNNPRRAITIDGIDLAAAGWTQVDGDWEDGWYGREDRPEDVVETHVPDDHNYVFVVSNVSQFSLSYNLFVQEV